MRSVVLGAIAAVAVVLAAGLVADAAASRTAQVEVAERAAATIRDKIASGEPALKRRITAIYRLSRARGPQNLLGVASPARAVLASNLRWAFTRDVAVHRALTRELAHVTAELDDIAAAEKPLVAANLELLRPLATADGQKSRGFGDYSAGKPARNVRLSSRGVLFRTRPGAPVVAPIAGSIVFSGKTHDGDMVVIEQGSVWVVLAPLADAPPMGTLVTRGQSLGSTAQSALELEMRVADDRGGVPVDPGPFALR